MRKRNSRNKSNIGSMKTLFIYAVAAHNSKIIKTKEIQSTLEKAKDVNFERVIIIKKSQLAAKTKELKTNFDVDTYPKKSIKKAISNANACLIIGNGIGVRRKHKVINTILETANEKSKLVMFLNIQS